MTYEPLPMPYREKTARLALVAMLVSYVPFFAIAAVLPPGPAPYLKLLAAFAAVSVLRLLILGGGYLGFRLQAPEDAKAPPDERDRAIARQAASLCYYLLMAAMLGIGCFMPFYTSGWTIVAASIFAVVAAEIVRCVLVVVGYRRGWHG
jgi:hypothetical protein